MFFYRFRNKFIEIFKNDTKIVSVSMKPKDKSLLVITNHFSSFVRDPIEVLKKEFKTISVINPTPYFPKALSKLKFIPHHYKQAALSQDFNYDNVFVYFPRFFHLPIEFFRKRMGNSSLRAVLRTIKKNNISFDIIHAHFTYPSGYVAVKLKERFNVPVVVTVHGHDIYKLPFKNKFFENKIKYILGNADKVITVSESNFKIIQKFGFGDKTKIIPNGFDSDRFKVIRKDDARKELGLLPNKNIVLHVGNLVEVKNQKNLILSFNELVKRRNDVLLYIVGGGPLEKELKRLLKKLNLGDKVFLVGPKPHGEIPLWMNAADVFVLPSYSEGNPTVMFEALGCGLPFIGTKVGGIPEIISSEEYGFLLDDPKDYETLAKLIDKALNKKWDKEKILNYAKNFTWRRTVEKLLDAYKNIG